MRTPEAGVSSMCLGNRRTAGWTEWAMAGEEIEKGAGGKIMRAVCVSP